MIITVYNILWYYCSAIYVHKTWLYDLRTNRLPVTPLTVFLSPAPHQIQEVDCIHHTKLTAVLLSITENCARVSWGVIMVPPTLPCSPWCLWVSKLWWPLHIDWSIAEHLRKYLCFDCTMDTSYILFIVFCGHAEMQPQARTSKHNNPAIEP